MWSKTAADKRLSGAEVQYRPTKFRIIATILECEINPTSVRCQRPWGGLIAEDALLMLGTSRHICFPISCVPLGFSNENCCPRPRTQVNVGCCFVYACVSLSLLKDPTRDDCFSSTACWLKVSESWSGGRNNFMWVRYNTNGIRFSKELQWISDK